jgi:hypothetical protein
MLERALLRKQAAPDLTLMRVAEGRDRPRGIVSQTA